MIGFKRDGGQIVAALEQTEAQVFGLVVAQVAGLIEYDRNSEEPDAELGANVDAELDELVAQLDDIAGDPDADPDASFGSGRTQSLADDFTSEAFAAEFPELAGMNEVYAAPCPDDPVLARLFPDGYRDDAEASAELRSLIQGDLHTQKLDHANTMLATLPLSGGEIRLDAGQAESWLLALNDARLVLGTRLGVTDEMDILDELDDAVFRDPAGPRVLALSVYHLLGYAQETLVEALTA